MYSCICSKALISLVPESCKNKEARMELSYKQGTALFGIVYSGFLLWFMQRLTLAWKRESQRSRYSLLLFAFLFVFSVASFAYVYFVMRKKQRPEEETPGRQEKEAEPNLVAKLCKCGIALVLSFGCLNRILMHHTS